MICGAAVCRGDGDTHRAGRVGGGDHRELRCPCGDDLRVCRRHCAEGHLGHPREARAVDGDGRSPCAGPCRGRDRGDRRRRCGQGEGGGLGPIEGGPRRGAGRRPRTRHDHDGADQEERHRGDTRDRAPQPCSDRAAPGRAWTRADAHHTPPRARFRRPATSLPTIRSAVGGRYLPPSPALSRRRPGGGSSPPGICGARPGVIGSWPAGDRGRTTGGTPRRSSRTRGRD